MLNQGKEKLVWLDKFKKMLFYIKIFKSLHKQTFMIYLLYSFLFLFSEGRFVVI